MIFRVWKAKISVSNEEAYLDTVRKEVLPEFEKIAGYKESYFLRQKHGETDTTKYLVLTLWESMDAIEIMTGGNPGKAFIPDKIVSLLEEYDTFAEHFEMAIRHKV